MISSIFRGCNTKKTGNELQIRRFLVMVKSTTLSPASGLLAKALLPSPRGPARPGEGPRQGPYSPWLKGAEGARPAPTGKTDVSINTDRGLTAIPRFPSLTPQNAGPTALHPPSSHPLPRPGVLRFHPAVDYLGLHTLLPVYHPKATYSRQ